MNKTISAQQARNVSNTDMVIYNEVDAISRAIYAAAIAGNLDATVNDGTTMTESTPTITVTGTVSNPAVHGGSESLTLAGESVTLPHNGDVDQIIAAINDANITGLVATKNSNTQIVLTYQPPQTAWTFTIGTDTGNATCGFTADIIAATDPDSVVYYNVWSGTAEDRKKSYEYSQVISYFQDLGYNILAKKNTITENTFYWEIYF
jgi:hypothetical protein